MASKKGFSIEISPTAIKDIDNAILYYKQYSKLAAENFYRNTTKTIDSLSTNPFYTIRFDQYRSLKIHKFPFLVVFK